MEKELDGAEQKAPEFDQKGFEILKQRMSQNPRIIVK